MPQSRQLAAIMFTDIVGYTALMGRDEDKAFSVLENNRALHKDILILYEGQLLKEIGDGMLCSFKSASNASKCAIELVRKSKEFKNLKLRIGIHVGEVVFSGADVFGDGVNIASRIEAMAIPDSVLVSGKVYDDIKNKHNIQAKLLGEFTLKNDSKTREIYALTNTGLKVPVPKDLKNTVEDRPDLQKIPSSQGSVLSQKSKSGWRFKLSSPRVGLTILFSSMAVAFGSLLFINSINTKNTRWAKDDLIPEVERLTDSISSSAGNFGHRMNTFKALDVAFEAAKYIDDPKLEELLDKISNFKFISSEPSGATVYIKSYHDANSNWKLLGNTPMDSIRVPLGLIRIKLEKNGFDPIEDLIQNSSRTSPRFDYRLLPEGSVPAGMTLCQGEIDENSLKPDDFFMDKYEVSNMEYKKFLDQGGYLDSSFWKYPIFNGKDTIPLKKGLGLFKDQTGQYGPSTWVAGDYPEGKEKHPVTGISWYEAAAYAEYKGKYLPTNHHFNTVALISSSSDIIPFANFNNTGTRETGNADGSLHRFGVYNLAGNAREWVYNLNVDTNGRFIRGGGWNDYDYLFSQQLYSQNPLDRSVSNGFRCIQYMNGNPETENPEFFKPFSRAASNYGQIFHFSPSEFKALENRFQYDHTPFEEEIEYSRSEKDWTRQKIKFKAPYGNEQIIAYLFLPNNSKPPYQCVLLHLGSGARASNSSETDMPVDRFDFIIKTGRAVLSPVYKGMYERNEYYGKTANNWPSGEYLSRDELIMRTKDFKRSVDYLETRADVDMDKLAYLGISWGAEMGGILLSVENRIKTGVLLLGGVFPYPSNLIEVNSSGYLPMVTVPILMLNGKYDTIFPLEISQKPFYELLGTSRDHKKMILYNEGHQVPRNEMIKESLNWLDTYLGPLDPGI